MKQRLRALFWLSFGGIVIATWLKWGEIVTWSVANDVTTRTTGDFTQASPGSGSGGSKQGGLDQDEPEVSYVDDSVYAPDSSVPTDVLLTQLPPRAHELIHLLHWMHTTSVRAFESATRFGHSRMYINTLFDEPSPPKHSPLLARGDRNPYGPYRGIDDTFLVKGQPAPSEAWMWLNLMYAVTSRGFVYQIKDLRSDTVERSKHHNSNQFGGGGPRQTWRANEDKGLTAIESHAGREFVVGVPSPYGKIDFHHHNLKLDPSSPLTDDDRLWKTTALQLISLLKHDPPVAYENRDPTMLDQGPRRQEVRPLDQIERDSLEKLREGTERVVAWNPQHERVQMVGAIRAKDRCLKCHDVQRGELLGAFAFWIEEIPGTGPKDSTSIPTVGNLPPRD